MLVTRRAQLPSESIQHIFEQIHPNVKLNFQPQAKNRSLIIFEGNSLGYRSSVKWNSQSPNVTIFQHLRAPLPLVP